MGVTAGGPEGMCCKRSNSVDSYGFESIHIFRVKIFFFFGILYHPFWLQFFALWASRYNIWNYIVWLKITDES